MRRGGLFFATRGGSPLGRFARALLLCGVFALVIVAFQKYFEQVVGRAAAKGTVVDTLGVLSKDDRAVIVAQAAALRRRYDLDLKVRLGGGGEPPASGDPKRVFMYYAPDCRGSVVILPPLAASALPAGFADDLGRAHLDGACREGRAREGVLAALGLLVETLESAANRGKGEEHERAR